MNASGRNTGAPKRVARKGKKSAPTPARKPRSIESGMSGKTKRFAGRATSESIPV